MVIRGTISLGEFVAFGAYLAMLHWPMIALGWVVNLFERARPRWPDRRDPERGSRHPGRGSLAVESIRDVEFRNMTFGYGERLVLHDIDLHVHVEDRRHVGPTGSGKSTLSLIARLDPRQGRCSWTERRAPDSLRTLRAAIGSCHRKRFSSPSRRANTSLGLRARSTARVARVDWSADVRSRQGRPASARVRDLRGERGITLGRTEAPGPAGKCWPAIRILILMMRRPRSIPRPRIRSCAGCAR